MKRAIKTYKVQAAGKRGRAVSLPQSWCQHFDVSPGDMVRWVESHGRLVLSRIRSVPGSDGVPEAGRPGADTQRRAT